MSSRNKRSKDAEKNPERILKLKEITDFLLAGGYFRVRIPSLSPFDKVIGGLCWSITASGVGVDIDLLFQEQLQIGQRIALSEKLVTALFKMKCPHPLQPHQIQGLDYDALLPVIQWSVKKVLETRRLTGDLVRALAVSQFDKSYALPSEKSSLSATEYVDTVKTKHGPRRQFRKAENAQFESIAAQAEATLLEYGEQTFGVAKVDQEARDRREAKKANRGGGKRIGGAATEAEVEAKEEQALREAEAEEKKKVEALKEQLATVEEGSQAGKLSGASVLNVMRQGANVIQAAEQQYEEAEKTAGGVDAVEAKSLNVQRTHERQLDALAKKKASVDTVIEEKMGKYKEMRAKVKELKAAMAEQQDKKDQILTAMAEAEQAEANATPEQKAVLAKMKELVFLNESLKRQEKQFKQGCKEERDRLTTSLANLKRGDGADDVETKRLREVERIFNADLAKLNQIRAVLAEKNQAIARTSREIDDIPTRAELLQFERRFVELNDLDAEKLLESRKYYLLYNTLDDSCRFMQNEVDLLNSIIEGFPTAQKSKGGMESYMKQVSDILGGITEQHEAVEKEYAQEVSMRDMLLAKYNKRLEQQRKYFKAVKEFQEECFKNEQLVNAVEELQRRAAAE